AGSSETAIEVERPADPAHGDYATNAALRLAKPLRRPPLEIAEAIRSRVALGGPIAAVEVAKPGFVNIRLSGPWLARQVDAIIEQGSAFGRSDRLAGQRIQVEYISANPTGPMTVANARGGPLGDVLANVLALAGADVEREFYVDDTGTQIDALGRSVAVRYRELGGDRGVPFPDDGYPADYVVDIARRIRDEDGAAHEPLPFVEQARLMAAKAVEWVVADQRRVAEKFGIRYDEWFRESSLVESSYFKETLEELRRRGAIEERDGAIWLRSSDPTDDREGYVIVRSNGEPTYFGKDIPYHRQALLERGFDKKIDVWGANTHGHMRKMRQALAALGIPAERWEVVLYQYVRFVHEGVLKRMGKRYGEFLLLEDVIDAVGVDAARYFLLRSSADRTLDFDFELAVQQSNENPVYYVQYAHARIASIFRTAAERGIGVDGADVTLLTEPGELGLVRQCLRLPELLAEIVERKGVHLLTGYALELAGLFHPFYTTTRVVTEDVARAKARLRLVRAVQVTLRQTLGLLGVSAPESM
ncbi:MAG: arginine--tRNA ligase, partial [Candidatus Limnocylindria bacterium]